MAKPKSILGNTDKIRLVKWLLNNQSSLEGWTISAITERATKELKISCVDSTVKRTIDDGELGIKYRRATSTNLPPIARLYHRVDAIEKAYIKLCNELGVTPALNTENESDTDSN